MKKIVSLLLSLTVAIAMVIDSYIVFFNGSRHLSKPLQESGPTKTTPPAIKSKDYKNGVFTGKIVSTEHGAVQVRAVIQGEKLTQVDVLKYPNSEDRSKQINNRVLPIYKQEAIKAQSANIQHISGATVTFTGFKGSLQDALNQSQQSKQNQQQTGGKNE